ncbi:hypothetical protein BHE74_00022295 [Ensete ventricosum]|nr:hypothetical protein BHE74_00022295 [Ensete ventricosum]
MCQAFLTTLHGIARGWYGRLSLASIHSFDHLAREFEVNFLVSTQSKPIAVSLLASTQSKPIVVSLLGMRQKEYEHLSMYLTHFIKEIKAILDVHPSLVIQAFMIGIRPSRLFWSLMEQPPMIVPEMLQRANQYVIVDALMAEKREDQKGHGPNPLKAHRSGSQGRGSKEPNRPFPDSLTFHSD